MGLSLVMTIRPVIKADVYFPFYVIIRLLALTTFECARIFARTNLEDVYETERASALGSTIIAYHVGSQTGVSNDITVSHTVRPGQILSNDTVVDTKESHIPRHTVETKDLQIPSRTEHNSGISIENTQTSAQTRILPVHFHEKKDSEDFTTLPSADVSRITHIRSLRDINPTATLGTTSALGSTDVKRLQPDPQTDLHKTLQSYLAIVNAVFGLRGRLFATLVVLFEFTAIIVLLQAVMWTILSKLFNIELWIVAVVSSTLILPFLLVRSWKVLAYSNGLSCLLVLIAIVFICIDALSNTSNLPRLSGESRGDPPTYANVVLAVSFIMFSLSGSTPSIPRIFFEAKEKKNFRIQNLWPAFAIVLLLFFVVGAAGVMTYGDDIDVLLTNNLSNTSNTGLSLSILIACQTFATMPPYLALIGDILFEALSCQSLSGDLEDEDENYKYPTKMQLKVCLVIRTIAFILTACISYFVIDETPIIMEIVGICCTWTSAVILPLSMATYMFWNYDGLRSKAINLTIISGALTMMVSYLAILMTQGVPEVHQVSG
ncbi:hypothetical protein AAMO2058_001357100 [Amorphochlora amoebiformis]